MGPLEQLSRRRLMKVSVGALLAANVWPGRLWAEDRVGEDFTMFVANDLHLVDKGCVPFFERVVAQMKGAEKKPDLCMILGDLSDEGTEMQIGTVKDLFSTLEMPLKVMIGNHDYAKGNKREAFEKLCPDSLNYCFEHRGWQMIVLDSTDGTKADVKVQPATLKWMDENLPKLAKAKPTMLFTHFPMGLKVPHRPGNADDLLGKLKDFNLRAIFGGHHHGFTERKTDKTMIWTGRCCSFRRQNHDGTKDKGYVIATVKGGEVAETFQQVKA